jgi:hypothetical protein
MVVRLAFGPALRRNRSALVAKGRVIGLLPSGFDADFCGHSGIEATVSPAEATAMGSNRGSTLKSFTGAPGNLWY